MSLINLFTLGAFAGTPAPAPNPKKRAAGYELSESGKSIKKLRQIVDSALVEKSEESKKPVERTEEKSASARTYVHAKRSKPEKIEITARERISASQGLPSLSEERDEKAAKELGSQLPGIFSLFHELGAQPPAPAPASSLEKTMGMPESPRSQPSLAPTDIQQALVPAPSEGLLAMSETLLSQPSFAPGSFLQALAPEFPNFPLLSASEEPMAIPESPRAQPSFALRSIQQAPALVAPRLSLLSASEAPRTIPQPQPPIAQSSSNVQQALPRPVTELLPQLEANPFYLRQPAFSDPEPDTEEGLAALVKLIETVEI